ncbi:EpsG family protein [Thermosynechococcus vestitus]|uniref:Tll1203 protein n=1 Tax=Thermosynechococcus vestitus (strain NIES-2133 / IAM M-273 / BP-1) TaxID=197221 RepID=Q8DJL9_THEVB|nr:EpsG family protein [Thermosynechococcus vestitus]BAC08755.1 tll1203 [Thermosynechococcus vestitus BP-1]
MLPYFIVFALTAIPVIVQVPRWYGFFLFFTYVLFIGLRFEVGADWESYIYILEAAKSQSWFALEGITVNDFGYHLINKLAGTLNQGIYFVNSVVALIFTSGLFYFCRHLKNSYAGLVVAFPYLTTVVAMGYTRQSGAIGFEMIALIYLAQGKFITFLSYLFLAILLHKTAIFILLIPLVSQLISAIQHRKLLNSIVLLFLLILFIFGSVLIINSTSRFLTAYIEGQMESSGTLIRLLMNFLPAFIFLMEHYTARNLFKLSSIVYLSISWLAILSPLLLLTGSTTAADRLALYLIPIQVYVLGQFPYLFISKSWKLFIKWLILIIAYSFVVLWVWLNFADHAFAWLPYRMYPFV